jgi:hypothetical protein
LSLLRFVCPYNSMHHKSYVKAWIFVSDKF